MMLAQVLSRLSLVGRGNGFSYTLFYYHHLYDDRIPSMCWRSISELGLHQVFCLISESPERPCYMRFGDDFESSLVPSECGRATMLIQEGPMRSQLGIQSYTNEPDKITRGW